MTDIPAPSPRVTESEKTPAGLARQDTLRMEEAFAKIAPRPPLPPRCPTGFGKPRRRR